MSSCTVSRRSLAVASLALILALAARAERPRALIQTDLASCLGGTECEQAETNLSSALLEQGISVDARLGPIEPGDLDGYDCVWDLRTVTPLDVVDAERLRAFLAAGNGAYLGGENILFDARNQSLADALNSWGAAVVRIWNARPDVMPAPSLFPDDVNLRTLPRHPAVDWLQACHPIDRVVYDGIGVGWFQLPGTGDVLTGYPGASPAAAWGFDRNGIEDLSGAPEGRVASVLDLNWLANAYRLGDNRAYAGSMARWLCGGPDASVASRPHCGPRTQGFWKRQCAAADGQPALLVDDWPLLHRLVDRILLDADLPQLAGTADPTCDALEPDPPSDVCERALAQVTAWILNAQYGLVTCDCAYDRDAVDAILRRDGGPGLPVNVDAQEIGLVLLGYIHDSRCAQAHDAAVALNEGTLLPGYEGEGDASAPPGGQRSGGGTGAVRRGAPAHRPRPRT